MNRKLLSLLLCLALVLTLAPVAASADEGRNYLALGDSITTGFGLADPASEGLAALIAQEAHCELTNAAADGLTAETLLAQLATGELDSAIADAQLITITCGGNDLMRALYEAAAIQYNTTNGTSLTAQDVKDVFAGKLSSPSKMQLAVSTMAIIDTFVTSEPFLTALASYETNMNGEAGVLAYIRALNPDARIILTTQYNPYKHFGGMFEMVKGGIEAGVALLNDVIVSHAEAGTYLVADVYRAFDASDEVLTNAVMNPLELDFHPNAAGHRLIANTIVAAFRDNCVHEGTNGFCTICGAAVLPEYAVTVTTSGSGVAGAMVAAASEGDVVELAAVPDENWEFIGWEVVSGEAVIADPAGMFTAFIMPAGAVEVKAVFRMILASDGDVNEDGKCNAKDATMVLQYYAGRELTAAFNETKADINGDGKINSKDAALMLQLYAGNLG